MSTARPVLSWPPFPLWPLATLLPAATGPARLAWLLLPAALHLALALAERPLARLPWAASEPLRLLLAASLASAAAMLTAALGGRADAPAAMALLVVLALPAPGAPPALRTLPRRLLLLTAGAAVAQFAAPLMTMGARGALLAALYAGSAWAGRAWAGRARAGLRGRAGSALNEARDPER